MTHWDDIRYFLAIARHGNITAAAKALGVNHSTVSRRIRALEEKHGVRLFERIPSGYEMTEAASGIYEIALEIETKHQHISRQLFGQDSRLRGEINLTMPNDILGYCLIDEVAIFREKHPEIQLNLFVAKGLKDLAAREADVAIRLTATPPDYLIGKKTARLQHGIYANDQIQAVITKTKTPIPLVLWTNDSALPLWAAEHFPSSEVALRVDDLYSMYAAVKAGIGIARMPCYMPDSLPQSTTSNVVKRLQIVLPESNWGVWVLSHVDLRHTARIRRCREFFSDNLQQRKDLFEGKQSDYFK